MHYRFLIYFKCVFSLHPRNPELNQKNSWKSVDPVTVLRSNEIQKVISRVYCFKSTILVIELLDTQILIYLIVNITERLFLEIGEGVRPRHRFMSAYEQRVEPPDRKWQYLLFAAEPYETIAFKVRNNKTTTLLILRILLFYWMLLKAYNCQEYRTAISFWISIILEIFKLNCL